MSKDFNVALIGCGRIAIRHSELLGNFHIAGLKLACVCDIDEEKAKNIGKKFSVPFYFDYHEMISKEDIDIIVILSESGNHAKHILDVIKYNKAIVVEKPMALRLDDAKEIISKCKSCNIPLFVVKQNRFNLPIKKTRQAFEQGKFGKMLMGTVRVRWCRDQEYYNQASWRGTWALDGGVIANQAIHHIDLLQWFLGDVESVFTKNVTSLVNIEAEDTSFSVLKFKNGALGIVEATTAIRQKDIEGSISLLGSNGFVEIGGFAANELKHWNFYDDSNDEVFLKERHNSNPPNVYGFGHKEFYEDMVNSLRENLKPTIGGDEGIKSLEIINGMYESFESKKEIFFPFEVKKSKLGR